MKKITDTERGERYYVLKGDKKIKHGEYIKLSNNGKLLIKGLFDNGRRVSIWEFYNPNGKLYCKYDYTNLKLSGLALPDSIKNKKQKLIVDGTIKDTLLTWPPVYLGSVHLFLNEFMKYFRFKEIVRSKATSGKVRVVVSFTVDKYGNTSNYHIKKPIDDSMDKEVIRAYQLMPDYWLPGMLNGQPVDVEVDYPISLELF